MTKGYKQWNAISKEVYNTSIGANIFTDIWIKFEIQEFDVS